MFPFYILNKKIFLIEDILLSFIIILLKIEISSSWGQTLKT